MTERIKSKREPVVADPEAHDEKGKFKKGHRVYSRKERGDRITRDLKQCILEGAALAGSDGKGRGGLLGYCRQLAIRYPKNYVYLLGKTLPLTVRDAVVSIGPVTVRVSPVPSGRFLSLEQMEPQGIVIDGDAERVPEDEQDGTTIPRKPLTH